MSVQRSGRGPWARLLASTIVGDEGSSRAELGRRLVRDGEVRSIRIETGEMGAVVDGETVAIATDRLPPRIWAAISSFARGNRPLEAAIAGREQSVHLEHLLTVDWDAPLVPRREAIVRSCSCALARRVRARRRAGVCGRGRARPRARAAPALARLRRR